MRVIYSMIRLRLRLRTMLYFKIRIRLRLRRIFLSRIRIRIRLRVSFPPPLFIRKGLRFKIESYRWYAYHRLSSHHGKAEHSILFLYKIWVRSQIAFDYCECSVKTWCFLYDRSKRQTFKNITPQSLFLRSCWYLFMIHLIYPLIAKIWRISTIFSDCF